MFEGLQHAGWVRTLATSRPLFGLVSVVHYSAVFFCVGTIVLLDLRILGVADRHQALSALARQLQPWIWIAFGSVVVSGFLLFAIEAGDYAAATPFRVKVLVILLALVSALVVEWSLPSWDRAPVMPITARLVAVFSRLLWLGEMLASVKFPAFTGLE